MVILIALTVVVAAMAIRWELRQRRPTSDVAADGFLNAVSAFFSGLSR